MTHPAKIIVISGSHDNGLSSQIQTGRLIEENLQEGSIKKNEIFRLTLKFPRCRKVSVKVTPFCGISSSEALFCLTKGKCDKSNLKSPAFWNSSLLAVVSWHLGTPLLSLDSQSESTN